MSNAVRSKSHLAKSNILKTDVNRASILLDTFYRDFDKLHGEGSMGLNVHNIGRHLVDFETLYGPIYGWSCFGFENANAHLLVRVHGTGDVTKQILDMKAAQAEINLQTQTETNPTTVQVFVKHMNLQFSRRWKCKFKVQN